MGHGRVWEWGENFAKAGSPVFWVVLRHAAQLLGAPFLRARTCHAENLFQLANHQPLLV
jgi:hypothetical protein